MINPKQLSSFVKDNQTNYNYGKIDKILQTKYRQAFS
jgi:hypothetical protein